MREDRVTQDLLDELDASKADRRREVAADAHRMPHLSDRAEDELLVRRQPRDCRQGAVGGVEPVALWARLEEGALHVCPSFEAPQGELLKVEKVAQLVAAEDRVGRRLDPRVVGVALVVDVAAVDLCEMVPEELREQQRALEL